VGAMEQFLQHQSGLTHRRTLDTGDAFKTQPACEAHASRQEKQFGGKQGDIRKRGCQEPRLRAESIDSVTRTKTRGVMANVTSCRQLEELGKEDA